MKRCKVNTVCRHNQAVAYYYTVDHLPAFSLIPFSSLAVDICLECISEIARRTTMTDSWITEVFIRESEVKQNNPRGVITITRYFIEDANGNRSGNGRAKGFASPEDALNSISEEIKARNERLVNKVGVTVHLPNGKKQRVGAK